MVRGCAPENLEIPGLVLAHHPGMTMLHEYHALGVRSACTNSCERRTLSRWAI
jgi:hypothetical protein